MSVQLFIHEIGRASDPTATQTTVHESADHALVYLSDRFGADHVRGGTTGGTIGGLNGRVFQASRTWAIRA